MAIPLHQWQPPKMDRAIRVLVVDDVEDVADSLVELLRVLGYDGCAVYNGISALELAGGYRPDVVIMDISMPGLDGLQTARCLKNDRRLGRTTFIAHTGTDTSFARKVAAQIGFAHFIRKGALNSVTEVLTALSEIRVERSGQVPNR